MILYIFNIQLLEVKGLKTLIFWFPSICRQLCTSQKYITLINIIYNNIITQINPYLFLATIISLSVN